MWYESQHAASFQVVWHAAMNIFQKTYEAMMSTSSTSFFRVLVAMMLFWLGFLLLMYFIKNSKK